MRTIGKAGGRTAWLSAALVGAALMLAACGGGGSGAPSAATPQSDNTPQQSVMLKAADYRPAQVSDRLVYALMGSNSPEPDVSTTVNKELKTVDGVEGLVVESYWNGYTSQIFDHFGADGWVYEIDPKITNVRIHKIVRLPATFQIGDTFVMGDETQGTPGFEGHVHVDGTINGLETITTPAGIFPNCVKVSVVETHTLTSTDYDGSTKTETIKDAYANWYAPGIGRVLYAYVDTETQASRPVEQLVAYQINGVRNETVRPVASLGAGPNESNHGRFDTITLQFNEPMQGMTLNTMTAVITDPKGNVIPGQVTHTDTTWTFRPDYTALKVSGQYQIQLTDVATDQAGNTVMPATWTVYADVTPPKFVKAEFADGQIVLTYDEEFLPIPGVSQLFFYGDALAPVIIEAPQISIEANRIIIGKKGGYLDLKYGATYHVQIDGNNCNGLGDLAGNVTPRYDIATITIPSGPY